jgi:hyperosmotically inducible periplasmic protein
MNPINNLRRKLASITLAASLTVAFLAAPQLSAASATSTQTDEQRLAAKIRKELITLPFYGVFDHFSFELQGRKVILHGQVTRPTLESSAVNVVKAIPGIEEVENRIEVLPLSRFDDQLRIALYRNIYGQSTLGRYTLGAIPSIHILVKNGNVTLVGRVMNEMDKNMAGIFANQVNGVFAVTNNLTVEKKS